MSVLPRVIIGATTFTVVVAGAFYLYYRTRHIFWNRKPSYSTPEEDERNLEALGENFSAAKLKLMMLIVIPSV